MWVHFTPGGGLYPDQPVISDSFAVEYGGLAGVNAAIGGNGQLHVIADGSFACTGSPCTATLGFGAFFLSYCPPGE